MSWIDDSFDFTPFREWYCGSECDDENVIIYVLDCSPIRPLLSLMIKLSDGDTREWTLQSDRDRRK